MTNYSSIHDLKDAPGKRVNIVGAVPIRDYVPMSEELFDVTGPGWRSLLEPAYDAATNSHQLANGESIPDEKVKTVGTDSPPYTLDSIFATTTAEPEWLRRMQQDTVANLTEATDYYAANPSLGKPVLPNAIRKETPVSQFRTKYEKNDEFKAVKLTKDNVRDIGAEIGKKLGGEILVGDESIGLPPFSSIGTPLVELVEGDYIVEGYDYEVGKPTFRIATLEERQKYDLR